MSAIEQRQDDLDNKVSQVLACTEAHKDALEDLKMMFAKYVRRFRDSDEGSPSVSIVVLENPVPQPPPLTDSMQTHNVGTSREPEFGVDVQDSSIPLHRGIGVAGAEKLTEVEDSRIRDRTSPPHAVQNLNGRREACPPPPLPTPPGSSSIVHPKSTNRSKESVAGAVPRQQPKVATVKIDRNPDATPLTTETKAAAAIVKTKAGAATVKGVKGGASTNDSFPYSIQGAMDGLLEVAGAVPGHSPQRQKKSINSGMEEGAATQGEDAPAKVRSKAARGVHGRPSPQDSKLLVFNVHGTLLDSSLLADNNPNTAIRATLTTDNRRVVFRPWLIEFLTRCFRNFEVAFWGSKSKMYMDKIVPPLLARLQDSKSHPPLFIWSAKECEATDFQDGLPVTWGKPLEKVFRAYPQFNLSNTVIVDHKPCRLGGNSFGNLVIPTAFYVKDIQKLGNDKGFLKGCLWPLLQGLSGCEDITDFRRHYPNNVVDPSVKIQKLYESGATSASTGNIEGEGTCR